MTPEREAELRALLRDPNTNVDNAKCAGFEALDALVKQRKKTDLMRATADPSCECCIEYECDCMEGVTW